MNYANHLDKQMAVPIYKKTIYLFIGIIFLCGILELFSFAVYSLISKTIFSFSGIYADRQNIVFQGEKNPLKEVNNPEFEVLHPYFGFVLNPQVNSRKIKDAHFGVPINEYGFLDNASSLRKASANDLVIGIYGGSVAYYFSALGTNALIQNLKLSPRYRDKNISIARVAIGGYKQPQQLIALAYLLSLGAHYDIIINLDGFNELALPPSENMPSGVFPFFPRRWLMRVLQVPSHQRLALMGKIAWIDNNRRFTAEMFQHKPLRYSVTANILWLYLDSMLSKNSYSAQTSLAILHPDDSRYECTGPRYSFTNDIELYKDIAIQWQQSSVLMHNLCQANDVEYWHFLQPCLFDVGSKTLDEEEKRLASVPNHAYRKYTKEGYPFLRQAGELLIAKGVPFYDLSRIFRETKEQVFLDCCHLKVEANAILGRKIAEIIINQQSCVQR